MVENKAKRMAVRFLILGVVSVVLLAAMVLMFIFGETPTYTEPVPPQAGVAEADETLSGGDVVLDGAVPLAGIQRHWSLLNLVVAVACIAVTMAVAVGLFARGKRSKNSVAGGLWAMAAIVAGFGPPVAFALTQDLGASMLLADGWTLGLITVLVLQMMLVLLMRRARLIDMERQVVAAQARR